MRNFSLRQPAHQKNRKYFKEFCAAFFLGTVLIMMFYAIVLLAIFLSGAGQLKYLCGAYGNEMIRSNCFTQEFGYFPVNGRKYDQEQGKWVTGAVDHKYKVKIRIITQEMIEYDHNITIFFKNQDDLDHIVKEYQLDKQLARLNQLKQKELDQIDESDQTYNQTYNQTYIYNQTTDPSEAIPCRVLNWITQQRSVQDDWGFKNSYRESNGDLVLKKWDDDKFTFKEKRFCEYGLIIGGSLIVGWLLIATSIGLITVMCDYLDYQKMQRSLNRIELGLNPKKSSRSQNRSNIATTNDLEANQLGTKPTKMRSTPRQPN